MQMLKNEQEKLQLLKSQEPVDLNLQKEVVALEVMMHM
jgi:hypothetical protein